MNSSIQLKFGLWLRRDGGVEQIVQHTAYSAHCWANKGGESWQDDGRLRSDKIPHLSDLIEYLGPIGHEICCLKPGSYLLSPEVYAGVKYQLGILNDDKCDSQEKWMALHTLSEALNVNEPVVPDPLFDYTDDEKAVAKAIVEGELEIPSLVEYVKVCGRPGKRCLYFHRGSTIQLSTMHGKWPLGDQPCDIVMSRVRECVRLMLEHNTTKEELPEELTSE